MNEKLPIEVPEKTREEDRVDGETWVRNLSTPEPPPTQNELPAVWDLVLADMRQRDNDGFDKYRTRLQPHNGRKPLIDAYQEALDLAVYLRQEIYERYGK